MKLVSFPKFFFVSLDNFLNFRFDTFDSLGPNFVNFLFFPFFFADLLAGLPGFFIFAKFYL